MKLRDSFDEVFGNKSRVLVVVAHPDDAEIICGGVIVRCLGEGKKVRLVVTTDGSKGTKDKKVDASDFGKKRLAEQMTGGLAMGIPKEEIFNLGIADGEIENTVENIGKIAYHIRQFKPEIIITHNPENVMIGVYKVKMGASGWVNHRDHEITGRLVCYAAYPYARDRAFFPEQIKDGLAGHSVRELLFADYYLRPEVVNFAIDKYLDKKRAGLAAHFSADDVEDYVSEAKTEDGYFEPLGWYKIY